MTRSRSAERRANLIAVGVLLGIVAILALFAYRPDAVPPSGVDTQAAPTLSGCINVFHLFGD